MNMFRKLTFVAVFLFAATVVNAEGMKVGVRLGYSMQSVFGGMGMLGLGAGVGVNVPVGPIFIGPEVAFLYRDNWSTTEISSGKAVDWTQSEFALSIPLLIKFLPAPNYFIAVGPQVDIPIAPEECFGGTCTEFTERADFDVSVVVSFGYIIVSNLTFDFRYVYGATAHHTRDVYGILPGGSIKSNPMNTYGFGITYSL
ncbi:MAG: PorT family protein [Fibromonadaceae bacterium]|jgi:hypothetical protein|nr:PorT family protein [Fibromonadaceae bacterium]